MAFPGDEDDFLLGDSDFLGEADLLGEVEIFFLKVDFLGEADFLLFGVTDFLKGEVADFLGDGDFLFLGGESAVARLLGDMDKFGLLFCDADALFVFGDFKTRCGETEEVRVFFVEIELFALSDGEVILLLTLVVGEIDDVLVGLDFLAAVVVFPFSLCNGDLDAVFRVTGDFESREPRLLLGLFDVFEALEVDLLSGDLEFLLLSARLLFFFFFRPLFFAGEDSID